jgi:hypothetical protein
VVNPIYLIVQRVRKMCDTHEDDEPTMIRLFGIKYANEIKNCKASEPLADSHKTTQYKLKVVQKKPHYLP